MKKQPAPDVAAHTPLPDGHSRRADCFSPPKRLHLPCQRKPQQRQSDAARHVQQQHRRRFRISCSKQFFCHFGGKGGKRGKAAQKSRHQKQPAHLVRRQTKHHTRQKAAEPVGRQRAQCRHRPITVEKNAELPARRCAETRAEADEKDRGNGNRHGISPRFRPQIYGNGQAACTFSVSVQAALEQTRDMRRARRKTATRR